jgi:pyruvate-formate lyase-activating enzyme
VTNDTYGFHGRLTSEFPSQVVVDVTEVCNLACIHCPHPEFKQSEHYQARYLDRDLNAKMVDEVRVHGIGRTQYIRYTAQGEPLVHPHCYDMLDYAVQESGTKVTLTTNGTILNEKRVEKLLATGLHMIDISIDAFRPDTYAKIRVNGDLTITQANALRMIEIAREVGTRTKVVVSFVEQSQNRAESSDFESFWKDAGADAVVIRRPHSAAGAVIGIAALLRAERVDARRYPCLYPWERIVLTSAGILSFCPQDWLHASNIADFRTASIRDTWQGDVFRALREAHLKNDFKCHSLCGNCPDWKQTRWPGQGLSYADLVEELTAQA